MQTVIVLLCIERCSLIPLCSPLLQVVAAAGCSFPFWGSGLDESSSLKVA